MSKVWVYSLLIVFVAAPAVLWIETTLTPLYPIAGSLPPGQWYYLLSKLCAQYAYTFLTLQILAGMCLVNFNSSVLTGSVRLHRNLALLTTSVIVLHIALFVAAVFLRSGHFPIALFVPRFNSGYYNFYISLGLIAVMILVLVMCLSLGRRFLSKMAFDISHQVVWIIWIFVLLHSLAIGTETRGGSGWQVFYVSSSVIVAILALMRIKNLIVRWFGPHST